MRRRTELHLAYVARSRIVVHYISITADHLDRLAEAWLESLLCGEFRSHGNKQAYRVGVAAESQLGWDYSAEGGEDGLVGRWNLLSQCL